MIYTFDHYELDTSSYELRRAGVPVPMLPKTFDLLAYLVQHHDRTVSKDDLYTYLWPDQFVSEAALAYHIAHARKAVGDNGRSQSFIKTVYGRGYRFLALVQEAETAQTAALETELVPELSTAPENNQRSVVAQPVEQAVE